MTDLNKFVFVLLSLIIFSFGTCLANPQDIFNSYLKALKDDNRESAKSFWQPEYISATERLGIQYENVPMKFDCASPIISNLDGIRNGNINIKIIDTRRENNFAELEIGLITPNDTIQCKYYAIFQNDKWHLTSLLFHTSESWHKRSTKYANIYYRDSSKINSIACAALDRFVDSVSSQFKIPIEEIYDLKEIKIRYVLCDKDEIQLLTGYNTKGMSDLALDAVVTQELPHFHELVHLLVNYKLKNIPLYTQPFLQEGLACHMGGRWGRSPELINYMGYVNLQYGLCQLGDLLTHQSFHNEIGTPDISYPASALFVNYLIGQCGSEKFMKLYRELSGSSSEVQNMSQSEISEKLKNFTGLSWSNLEDSFNDFWPRFSICGISISSVDLPDDSADYVIGDKASASIWELNFESVIEFDIDTSENGFFLLLTEKQGINQPEYISKLFEEHLPNTTYRGQRYGIRFTSEEVGIYDYMCNSLICSYVSGFSPDFNIANMPKLNRVEISNTSFPINLNEYDFELIAY